MGMCHMGIHHMGLCHKATHRGPCKGHTRGHMGLYHKGR